MKTMRATAAVIGGGFAGLSVSAYLARAGYRVQLFEKNDQPGGRARYWSHRGDRFDMGPSWYLMPEVFERFFTDIGRRREDYYELKRLDPYYTVFFSPDESVTVGPDIERTVTLFESFEPGGGARLRRYLEQARYKYDVAMRQFLYRDYRRLSDFFSPRMLIEGSRLRVLSSLDKQVRRSFRDRRARQILEYAMVFLGTRPEEAPALYSIMSHVDMNLGVYYPAGGLAGVAQAMEALARQMGVELRTSRPVSEIRVEGDRATGVVSGGRLHRADVVVSAADYAHTELELLGGERRTYDSRYWERRVVAPSMFVAFLGVNKRLPRLQHHNLYFSESWNQHFDAVFSSPAWPPNPCFYLSCISKTDADAAPNGAENLFLLVPVAPGMEDTDEARESYFQLLLDHVERVTGESLSDAIAVKRLYSHRDFAADYNAYQGTALGLAHTLGQTAVFRPQRRSRKVRNLYYTGQYTHPGVGVPMTLISSEVTAREIRKDER